MDDLLSQLTCSLCIDRYDHAQQQPKSLPCLHTFCKKCLQLYFENNFDSEELPCPQCREIFPRPEHGVDDLKTNFMVKSLLDSAADLQDKTKPKPGKQHTVISRECGVHGNKSCTFICLDCKVGQCNTCILQTDGKSHDGHTRMEAAEYFQREQQQIDHEKKRLQKKITLTKEKIAMFSSARDSAMEECWEDACAGIDEQARKATDVIQQWKQQQTKNLKAALDQRREEVQNLMRCLESTMMLHESNLKQRIGIEQLQSEDEDIQRIDQNVDDLLKVAAPVIKVNRLDLKMQENLIDDGNTPDAEEQSVTQEDALPVSQPVTKPASEPVAKPDSQPVTKPAGQSLTQPASQPVKQQVKTLQKPPVTKPKPVSDALKARLSMFDKEN